MRNWKLILRAFAGGAALTTIAACEEVDPPKPAQPPAPVASAPAAKPVLAPQPVPVAVEPAPVEPKPSTPMVAATDPSKPSEILGAARGALTSGELDRALRLAKLAVQKMPARSAAWNTLGRVQLQRGERKDAIASFTKATELNPTSSYAQNNLGLALIYGRQFDDAIDALEEATELEPVEPYMWNNLGMAYEHMDRLEEARDAYRKAASLKSTIAEQNLVRLEGVRTVLRTAKIDQQSDATVQSGTPRIEVEPPAMPDGGDDH